MRNVDAAIGGRSAVALRHALLDRDRAATASTTLANSTSTPSPIVLTIRPPCSAISGSISSPRCAFSAASVPPRRLP